MANSKKPEPKLIYETPESQYKKAVTLMQEDELIVKYSYKRDNYLKAAEMFESVEDYKDAASLAHQCRLLAEEADRDAIEKDYAFAVFEKEHAQTREEYERTAGLFEKVSGYKDADQQLYECNHIVAGFRKRSRLKWGIAGIIVVALIAALIVFLNSERWILLKTDLFGGSKETERAVPDYQDDKFRTSEEGDVVSFGQFEWDVLENDGQSMLLVLLHAENLDDLRGRPYHESFCPVTWEGSSTRAWLNEDFLMKFFTDEERALIQTVTNQNHDNDLYGTKGGEDTSDQVYLPSEADVLAHSDVFCDIRMNIWLRDPGHAEDTAMFMASNTKVMEYGYAVDSTNMYCVPLVRVSLD